MAAVTETTVYSELTLTDGTKRAGKFKIVPLTGSLVYTGRLVVQNTVGGKEEYHFDAVVEFRR